MPEEVNNFEVGPQRWHLAINTIIMTLLVQALPNFKPYTYDASLDISVLDLNLSQGFGKLVLLTWYQ